MGSRYWNRFFVAINDSYGFVWRCTNLQSARTGCNTHATSDSESGPVLTGLR